MQPIFAVAIAASQGSDTPVVTATLTYAEEHARSAVNLRWELPTRINAPGQAGEWLYAVLSRLVQDFDDHTVERVTYETDGEVQEETNA